jgi:excisionase family DNA binding protein
MSRLARTARQRASGSADVVTAETAESQVAPAVLALLHAVIGPIVRAAVRAELEETRADDADPRAQAKERLTLREAANALRLSERSVRRLVAAGRLRAARVTGSGSSPIIIARSEVDRFLRELEGP